MNVEEQGKQPLHTADTVTFAKDETPRQKSRERPHPTTVKYKYYIEGLLYRCDNMTTKRMQKRTETDSTFDNITPFERADIIRFGVLGDGLIDKALADRHTAVRMSVVKYQHLIKEQVDRALADENWQVRMAVAKHQYLTKEQVDIGLEDKYYEVRTAIIVNQNLTGPQLDRARADPNQSVRVAANVRSPLRARKPNYMLRDT